MNQIDIVKQELKSGPRTVEQLANTINKKPNNVRAKISSLRKKGLEIKKKKNGSNRSIYWIEHSKHESMGDRIVELLKNNNLLGKPISVTYLSYQLKESYSDIEMAISKLFSKRNVIQIDKNKVVIR